MESVLNFCSLFSDVKSAEDASDGIVFFNILEMIEGITCNGVKVKPESWQGKLSNLKLLVSILSDYSIKNGISLEYKSRIQLVQIAKDSNGVHLMELFEWVFDVVINSRNRTFFIQKITELEQNDQEVFSHKIMKILNKDSSISIQHEDEQTLLNKLNDLEDQIKLLKGSNSHLQQNNHDILVQLQNYKRQNKKLIEEIHHLERQISDSYERQETSASKSLVHSQLLIKQLQDKLIFSEAEFQKKYCRLEQQMGMLQDKYSKLQTIEDEFFESKIKTKELIEKITVLEEEKQEINERLNNKVETVRLFQQKIQTLTEDCNKKQFARISLKAENAKSNARSSELKRMLQMSFEHQKSKPKLSSQTLLQDPFQQKYQQIKSSLTIANRRVKQLQKQLAKSNVKAQKLDKTEQQKKKLEQVLIDMTNSRGQQIQILINTLYQLRIRYDFLAKRNAMQDSTFIE